MTKVMLLDKTCRIFFLTFVIVCGTSPKEGPSYRSVARLRLRTTAADKIPGGGAGRYRSGDGHREPGGNHAQSNERGRLVRRIQCESCPTRGLGWVCDLPREALDDFGAAGTFAVYKPRQVIFSEGSESGGLYLICLGAVKLYHSDRFGNDHILEIAGPGAVLGEIALESEQRLSVSAETMTEAQLRFLPREQLVRFLQKHPVVGLRLIAALSRELALARRKVRDLALKGAETRLASLLVQLASVNGEMSGHKPLQLRYTRRELAEMIGVSTETAIRLLGKLKQKRAITIDRRDVVISDLEKLTRLAKYYDIDS